MFQTRPAALDLPLDTVIKRLAGQEAVDGVLLIGSTGGPNIRDTSDYDLLIVTTEPTPLHVGMTRIDGRLTDLVFMAAATIDELLALAAPVPVNTPLGGLVRWLQSGRIALDRSGRLVQAQAKVSSGAWVQPDGDYTVYHQWFKINYNLRHNQRLIRSDDPLDLLALEMRLLYCLSELTVAYFLVRGLAWDGDKKAIRYWQQHDVAYLVLLQEALAADDLETRQLLYARLAALTLAPAGGLWDEDATALNFAAEDGFAPERVTEMLDWWQALLSDS